MTTESCECGEPRVSEWHSTPAEKKMAIHLAALRKALAKVEADHEKLLQAWRDTCAD